MRKTFKNPIKERQNWLQNHESSTTENNTELDTIQFVLKTIQQLIPAKSYYYRLPKIFKECLEK